MWCAYLVCEFVMRITQHTLYHIYNMCTVYTYNDLYTIQIIRLLEFGYT